MIQEVHSRKRYPYTKIPRVVLIAMTIGLLISQFVILAQTPSSLYAAPSLAWSPDGKMLAVAGNFGIQLVTSSLQPSSSLTTNGITFVAWSPDGKRIAGAGLDNSVTIWDITSGKLFRTL